MHRLSFVFLLILHTSLNSQVVTRQINLNSILDDSYSEFIQLRGVSYSVDTAGRKLYLLTDDLLIIVSLEEEKVDSIIYIDFFEYEESAIGYLINSPNSIGILEVDSKSSYSNVKNKVFNFHELDLNGKWFRTEKIVKPGYSTLGDEDFKKFNHFYVRGNELILAQGMGSLWVVGEDHQVTSRSDSSDVSFSKVDIFTGRIYDVISCDTILGNTKIEYQKLYCNNEFILDSIHDMNTTNLKFPLFYPYNNKIYFSGLQKNEYEVISKSWQQIPNNTFYLVYNVFNNGFYNLSTEDMIFTILIL